MAVSSILPGVGNTVTSATTNPAAATASSTAAAITDNKSLASNFTNFLQLLTTQLKNQNPLDPLDTNQFTQQLVQFAQVEQQLKSNSQLQTLVSLQQTAQSTQALAFVGETVAVDGATTTLSGGKATWTLNTPKPSTGTIVVRSSTGATVYTGAAALQSGRQTFAWNGKDNAGVQWPDGDYTISVIAADASGQAVAVASEIQGPVNSVDLTQTPPLLSIAGRDYTLDKIKRIVRQ